MKFNTPDPKNPVAALGYARTAERAAKLLETTYRLHRTPSIVVSCHM